MVITDVSAWNRAYNFIMESISANIIRSVCKVGKSIRAQKDVSYVKRQGYENLWLEVTK